MHEKEQICVFFYAQTVSETQRCALWRAHRLGKLYHYMQPNVVVLGIDEPTVAQAVPPQQNQVWGENPPRNAYTDEKLGIHGYLRGRGRPQDPGLGVPMTCH